MRKAARPRASPDDTYVSTATAKSEWFLTTSQLHSNGILKTGGGAVWGAGRVPTYYRVKDLDRVAVRVHGAEGFAKRKEARAKRLQKKKEKQKKPAKRPLFEHDEGDVEKKAEKQKKARTKKAKADGDEYEEETKQKKKPKQAAPLSEQEERNLLAVGKWNVDDDDCEVLEIRKPARNHELRGDAVVSGCNVKLHCADIAQEEMQFKATFKTQKANLVGQMRITVENKNKLSVVYNNGGKGMSHIVFDAVATRAKQSK